MKTFNITKSVSLALVIACSLGVASAIAQERSADRSIGSSDARVQDAPASSTFAVLATTPDVASDGLQFRIAYDPDQVRVSSTSDCLIGLPKNLGSSLASCKDIKEMGFVQIAIVDFSGQKAIPAGLELGFVEFETIGGKGSEGSGSSFWVEDVHVSGAETSAREDFRVSLGKIDY